MPDRLPASRVPDPMTAPPLRWGIVGTGWVAERFVAALQRLTRQQVTAVGSRARETAEGFAHRFGIGRAYGSYEELAASPVVDVVYVATPHNLHLEHAGLALRAGRGVLVEKPIGLNAAQARAMADLAAERSLFAAEALWTLFLPKFDVIAQVLDLGLLGEVQTVLADHGEWFAADHRVMRQDLAGGPLLDLGTYPVSFAGWVLGAPTEVAAYGDPAPNGINGQTSALLRFAGGAQAVLHTTILGNTPTRAAIVGTAGTLTIAGPFYQPGGFAVESVQGGRLTYAEPESAFDGLAYEAAEVARRITSGDPQTPIRPLADSVATMTVLDEIRRQVGQVFDDEH